MLVNMAALKKFGFEVHVFFLIDDIQVITYFIFILSAFIFNRLVTLRFLIKISKNYGKY